MLRRKPKSLFSLYRLRLSLYEGGRRVQRYTVHTGIRSLDVNRLGRVELNGREVNLRWMQPMALYLVNSIFTSGYLTTPGATPSADHQMIRDLGFEIEEVAPALVHGHDDGTNQQGLHADG